MNPLRLLRQLAPALICLLAITATAAPGSDDALKTLKEGNARYVAGKAIHPNQDAARRTTVAKGQHPFATILTCSDSRVPAELLFDQGLGDVFTVRVAGNVSDTDEVGSIEYGVGHLNTPLLIVMGHTSCGAVKAVLEGATVHGSIPELVDNIVPAVAKARAANPNAAFAVLFGEAVKANVWVSIDDLFKRSSEVRELVKAGKLQVIGAVYDLETGAVAWLGGHPEQARLLTYTGGAGHEAGTAHGEAETHATAATVEHSASATAPANVHATTTIPTALEPRVQRWVIGTAVALLVLMGAVWLFANSVMTRWQMPQRIAAGFTMMLLLLGAVGYAGFEGLHGAATGFIEYQDDARHSVLTGQIQAVFLDMRIAAKGIQTNRKTDGIRQYEAHRAKMLAFIAEARQEIKDPACLQMIETVATQLDQHYALLQQLGKTASPADITETGKRLGSVGEAIEHEIEKLNLGFIEAQKLRGPVVNRDMKEMQCAVVSIAVGALGLGVFLAWLISRSIFAPLRVLAGSLVAGLDQTASATSQIAAASQQLAEGASEQAASLEETSASLEEMTSMTKRNAESAGKAKTIAGETRVAADVGTKDMADMKNAMNEIKASSTEVAKIVKDIDEIAFQTNILALNAAVEAARAGEAGMGFAVVADEVRNLAQRSAKSAKETAAKIEDAIAKSERGVQISAKVAASFEQIATKTREVDQYVVAIASASQEQAQGVGQISTTVAQMDKVTQSNAASAEESASASAELNAQAESMKECVNELQRLMGTATPALAAVVSRPVRNGITGRNGSKSAPMMVHNLAFKHGRNGNGRTTHAPALVAANGRDTVPMSGGDDFKKF